MEEEKPRVGVGVMLLKNGKILLGKRHEDKEKADSDLHGEGTWTMPGGKLEFKEGIKQGAKREVMEEAGIKCKGLKIISVSNDIAYGNHFITIGWLCTDFEGDAKVTEPDEITEWKWFPMEKLPEKIFKPTENMLKNYKNKRLYDESQD